MDEALLDILLLPDEATDLAEGGLACFSNNSCAFSDIFCQVSASLIPSIDTLFLADMGRDVAAELGREEAESVAEFGLE